MAWLAFCCIEWSMIVMPVLIMFTDHESEMMGFFSSVMSLLSTVHERECVTLDSARGDQREPDPREV